MAGRNKWTYRPDDEDDYQDSARASGTGGKEKMPTSSHNRALRSSRKTDASRQAAKNTSRTSGGMHQRRKKRW